MGRLYDRQDLAWNTDYWDRQEQMLHSEIANGYLPGSFLDRICHVGNAGKTCKYRERYDMERRRERMKLLRTGTLMRELNAWLKLFKACPHCKQAPKKGGGLKDVPCLAHKEGLAQARSAVYWAGEHNVEERQMRGQNRAEGERLATAQAKEPNPLNKWESQYQRDKAEGAWLPRDAKREEVEYTYKGWLEFLFESDEMTQEEYLEELGRLKKQAREVEEMAALAPLGKLKRDKYPHIVTTQSGYTTLT